MVGSIELGQVLKGKLSSYRVTKKLYENAGQKVWLAMNKNDQPVIIKGGDRMWSLNNERTLLQRFQSRAPLRPLIDDIEGFPEEPPLVLKYFDENLLDASKARKLTSMEVKFVAKKILQALEVLHSNDYIHTDVKPSNILANLGNGNERFGDIVLADLGETLHKDNPTVKRGAPVGAAIFRAPEAFWGVHWGPPIDIWSFGTTLISLLLGNNFHIFHPNMSPNDDKYITGVLLRQIQYFGGYTMSYMEIAAKEALAPMIEIMNQMPFPKQTPFRAVSDKEVSKEDKEFILKIMKMDPSERPTAAQLLQDKWFEGV